MILDGNDLPSGMTLSADVAIVGSGPAGLTLADMLAAQGWRTLLLEAGGLRQGRHDADALRGESIGQPFPLEASRQRAFAGTASHWTSETGLRIRPFEPIDFETRPGLPLSGWPMSFAELAPFYATAREDIGLPADMASAAPPGEVPFTWPGGPEAPRFEFADHRTYTDRFENVVRSPHIELVLNATVAGINLDGAPARTRDLAVVTRRGTRFRVVARLYVLACGGIDNARMLLASSGVTGAGVGNEHDNVGRYFMDHISADSGIFVPFDDANVDLRPFQELRDDGGIKHQYMLTLPEAELRARGLPGAVFWVNRLDADYLHPAVQSARTIRGWRRTQPRPPHFAAHMVASARGGVTLLRWGARNALHRRAREGVVALRVMAEQLPNRESRVTLSGRRDALGIPRVRLDWRIEDADRETIRHHQDQLAALFETRGLGTIRHRLGDERPPAMLWSNYHHMGTTRMHTNPLLGVVDSDCRVHSVPNLFIAGSSVFPTGGYANPTLTIVALALRLARTLQAELRPLEVRA